MMDDDLTALERARLAVLTATDASGLLVRLADPYDIDDVRAKMLYHAASLQFGNVHLKLSRDGVSPSKNAEEVAARNTALLATLLAEHLRAIHG